MILIANLETYLDYVDPNIGIWRSGKLGDEYKARADSLPIINGIVTLIEIPSANQRVQVSGFIEVPMEVFIKNKLINTNEFVVDYSTGIVQLHPDHEAKTFTFLYYGKGVRLIAASRVYAMVRNNPDIIVTLQDYIESLAQFNESLTLKLTEINNAIIEAQQVTEQSNISIDQSITATQNANHAAQIALDAAASAIIIRQEPVDDYEDLTTTYPNPENGWQVILNKSGDIYRYDGVGSHQWEYVGNLLGGIPYAAEDSDGIVKTEDYKKFIIRTFFFSIPKILTQGVQTCSYGIFPFDGEIINAEAYCTEVGLLNETELIIEKISKEDLINHNSPSYGVWDNIFSQNLIINPNVFFSEGGIIADSIAYSGDILRLTISDFDTEIRGITVKIDIKTNII